MTTKRYRYPSEFRFIKGQAKVVLALLPLLLIGLMLFRSEYNLSTKDYRLAISIVTLGIFLSLLFIGSWCDIAMDNDGLYVEFVIIS